MKSCTSHQHMASYLPYHLSLSLHYLNIYITGQHYSTSPSLNPVSLFPVDRQYCKYKMYHPWLTLSLGAVPLTDVLWNNIYTHFRHSLGMTPSLNVWDVIENHLQLTFASRYWLPLFETLLSFLPQFSWPPSPMYSAGLLRLLGFFLPFKTIASYYSNGSPNSIFTPNHSLQYNSTKGAHTGRRTRGQQLISKAAW